ncbi:UNVERIFIED_CONTAM: hypothetical protein Sradi_6648700 [Sesamum radiatum]|uniref:Aminotransferase-like plant mobile domain-containing protein n=1 Tax=Sesamum radiatum TaxID=300843 RepID=A0AAW2JMS6_SESRA
MVYFKDISTPFGVLHLVILDDEKQPEEKGMVLMAHTPLIGRYASQWPRLTNPLYTEQWSREVPLNKTSKVWSLQATNHHRFNEPSILPTLGRRMIEGKAKRGDAIQFFVEFRYIKGFWEWTEDILSRCEHKLVTAQVHNSVFPINGLVYDEVVPCAKELDGVDEMGWRRGVVHGMFLAAYLACWLYTFALPTNGVGSIRPSTFKVATIMAADRRVGLTVLVLASIYKGLNKIFGSSRLICVSSPFPIHFVYNWIAHYFKTHYQVLQGVRGPKMTLFSDEGGAKYYDPQEVRKRIHKDDFVSWTCNIIAKDKEFSFVDDGRAKEFEEAYFMTICSNYLPLRQGGHFDVEPYSPHRFGHQFGFFQEVPKILSQDIRRTSLDDGIRYWCLCISSKTMEKV